MNIKAPKPTTLYYLLSVVCLLMGYGFYLVIRQYDPVSGGLVIASSLLFDIPALARGSAASFLHVLALSLLCYALVGARQHLKLYIAIFWILLNVIFEFLQIKLGEGSSVIPGTFDVLDILAIVSGGIVFVCITAIIETRLKPPARNTEKINKISRVFVLSITGIFGLGSILASGQYEYDSYEVVYMSYEELRSPLNISTDRGLLATGKIYTYQNYLLVNEPNKGIHLYDNSDTSNPVHIAFLHVPGNLDIAVRDGFLYADSFIDLVVIDINDINNISIVHRQESIFPYDRYQALADEKQNYYFSWDESKGVVIDVIYRPVLY